MKVMVFNPWLWEEVFRQEENLQRHMTRKEAEELLAAEAQTKQARESAFEEAERLDMVSRGCSAGQACSLNRNGV